MLDEVHASPRTPKDATQPQTRLGSRNSPSTPKFFLLSRKMVGSFPHCFFSDATSEHFETSDLGSRHDSNERGGETRQDSRGIPRNGALQTLLFFVVVVVGFFLSFRLSRSFPCPHFSAVSTTDERTERLLHGSFGINSD